MANVDAPDRTTFQTNAGRSPRFEVKYSCPSTHHQLDDLVQGCLLREDRALIFVVNHPGPEACRIGPVCMWVLEEGVIMFRPKSEARHRFGYLHDESSSISPSVIGGVHFHRDNA